NARGEPGRIGRPAPEVDVQSVGLVVDHLDARARGREDPAADRRSRAIRAVEHDAQPARVDPAREALAVHEVALDEVAGVDDDAEALRRRAGELVRAPDQLLEL